MTLWRKKIIQREGNQMSKQPEALRLADEIRQCYEDDDYWLHVAAELRRLHEVNVELVEALERIGLYIAQGDSWGARKIAEATFVKATGEQHG
jgi:hypothetical protein